ncbi:MAG: hypothetical protein PHZ26_02135 [Candidatus Gracilibacteria bacterium]|nr:hypothetical protein [Candidatus Gracilibacteria bacterium]MDD2908534.1 hypothetical protein [Candidatus Gracilibacteria bacterium]
MTKTWEKFINKNSFKSELKKIISDIEINNLQDYQIAKLSGYENYYRIRKGKIRIIFIKNVSGNEIKAVDTRGDIYKGM